MSVAPPRRSAVGRLKSPRVRLRDSFLKALVEDFEADGQEAIAKCRTGNAATYLRVVAAILPKEVNVKVSELEGLDNDELNDRIYALQRAIADALGVPAGAGASAGGEETPARPH